LFSNTLFNAYQLRNDGQFDTAAWILQSVFGPPLAHAVVLLEAGRLWLISYDLHHLHASQNEQWKTRIDTSIANTNWYIKNRNTFGNKQYVMRRVFIYYLFLMPLIITSYTIGILTDTLAISFLIDGFFFSIVLCVVLVIGYKCRNHHTLNDKMLFYYEIRLTSIIWVGCMVIYIIVQVINFAGVDHRLVADMAIVCVTIFASAGPSLMSIAWIPRKIGQSDMWQKQLISDAEPTTPDVDTTLIQLEDTLKSKDKFGRLIRWMYREFSSENVLCFIELVQFQIHCRERVLDDHVTTDLDPHLYELYDGIPQSIIVHPERFNNQEYIVGIVAHALFEKYIERDSEFMVNISHKLRSKMAKYDANAWNIKQKEIIAVFQRVIDEMFIFIRQSFERYQQN